MDHPGYVFLSVGFIFLVIAAFFLYSPQQLSPAIEILHACDSLVYNGEDKIDLLFFGDRELVESYSSYLLSKEPFAANKQSFNIFYISDYIPTCELYQGVALFCYSKELIASAAACPHDYIFTFEEQDESIRSSAYMKVASINTNHPLPVLLHEFGHSFGNFAEEYVPAEIPRGAKNCVSSCNLLENSCFQGCSRTDYHRSIENGVMRTLETESYGDFNDALLNAKITKEKQKSITGLVAETPSDCNDQTAILAEAVYDGEKITVKRVQKIKGCADGGSTGAFQYEVVFEDGTIIPGKAFNPENLFTDGPNGEGILDGEMYNLNGNSFFLLLPDNEGTEVLFKDENNEVIGSASLEGTGAYPCRI